MKKKLYIGTFQHEINSVVIRTDSWILESMSKLGAVKTESIQNKINEVQQQKTSCFIFLSFDNLTKKRFDETCSYGEKRVCISWRIKTKSTIWNIRKNWNLTQGLEQLIFPSNPRTEKWTFRLRPWMKDSNLEWRSHIKSIFEMNH